MEVSNKTAFSRILLIVLLSIPSYAYTQKHSAYNNSPENIRRDYYAHKYENVIIYGNNYLKLYPKDTDILLYVGYSYYKRKEYQEAIDAFTKIVNLSNKYEEVWPVLAQSYISLEQYPQALNVVNNGLNKFPKNKALLKDKAYLENKLKPSLATKTASDTLTKETKNLVIAQKSNQTILKKQNKITYEKILATYKSKNYTKAELLSKQYLTQYPKDTDVKYILALSYIKQKKYTKAEKTLTTLLNKSPNNLEARKQLINTLFAQKKYTKVISVANDGIAVGDNKNEWYYQQGKAYYQQGEYKKAITTLQKINNLDHYTQAKKLYESINEETGYQYIPHNEFGFYNSQIQVRNPDEPWNITMLYGLRKNDYGAFGGFVNYQHRPDNTGYQWGLIAQPKLTQSTYLDLAYAYSDEPALFANDYIHAEAYQYLPFAFKLSLGDGYRKIEKTNLNAYTASLTKALSNYEIGVRPIYYVPKEGPNSTLYKLYLKRYGEDPEQQIGFVYATGQSPDLDDLQTVNFFKVDDNFYMINGQQPVNKKLLFQYGLGYEEQKFPNGTIRRYIYINIGAKFKAI